MLLAWLRSLGLGAAAVVVLLAYNGLVENPQLVTEAKRAAGDACTIHTMDAANRAEAAERTRITEVSAKAVAGYRLALDREERLRRAAENQRDKETTEHERELAAAGRFCVFTDDDFDWLRHQRGTAAGGG